MNRKSQDHGLSKRGAEVYEEALGFYQIGCYAEAEKLLLTAVEYEMKNLDGLMLLAKIYAKEDRLEEALEYSQRAISYNNARPAYYYLRSTILLELGALEEARASLRRTLILDPMFVMAHYALASLALQLGQVEESTKHFENALSLLRSYGPEDIVPESEAITAGNLVHIVQSSMRREA
jgi:chemotaxis protein methyltransferase CheR